MNLERKTIVASAGGLALTMGIVILLVLSSMVLPFPSLQQITNPYFIFIFSLLIIFPIFLRRLNRLDEQNKVIGWTLIGLAAQLIILPLPLMFLILTSPSTSSLLFGGLVLTGSVVFGVPAGLLSAVAGIYILKRKNRNKTFQNSYILPGIK